MVEIDIKIKIKDINKFKEAFNKVVTRPPQYQGLTDLQFFKAWIKDSIFNAYKTGRIKIAEETTAPDIDLNIIEVT